MNLVFHNKILLITNQMLFFAVWLHQCSHHSLHPAWVWFLRSARGESHRALRRGKPRGNSWIVDDRRGSADCALWSLLSHWMKLSLTWLSQVAIKQMHAFSVLFQAYKLFSTSVNASWRWTAELRLFWSFYIHVFLVSCSGVSQSLLASGVHRARQGQQQMLRQDHLQQTRQRKIRATKMQPTNVPESVAATSLSSWFVFCFCFLMPHCRIES